MAFYDWRMTNKSKLVAGIIAIVIIAAILIGLNTNQAEGGLKIGFIGILSGEYATVGQNFLNGTILANESYNQKHPNAQIEMVVEDDAFNGGKGVSAYQKLVNVDKVKALINTSTPTIDSIYKDVTMNGMPVIQAGEQSIEPTDDNVFGIFPNSIDSEYDYGVYMRQKGIKEMTLVYMNHDAMIRFVEAFKRGFQGKTMEFKINADEKDFRTHAVKVASVNSKNVGLFMFPQPGAQFLKEYFKVDKSKPAYFFDANFQSGYSDYQRLLGDLSPINGALIGTIDLATTDEFKSAYKKRFGTEAGFFSDVGYDAFNILIAARSDNNNKWINDLRKTDISGASGQIKFGPTGNRLPKTKIMTIKDGKLSDL